MIVLGISKTVSSVGRAVRGKSRLVCLRFRSYFIALKALMTEHIVDPGRQVFRGAIGY